MHNAHATVVSEVMPPAFSDFIPSFFLIGFGLFILFDYKNAAKKSDDIQRKLFGTKSRIRIAQVYAIVTGVLFISSRPQRF